MDIGHPEPVAPPQTVFTFFRREYFKHKSKFTDEIKNMRDATEMWMNLNPDERETFRIRFEDDKRRREEEYARYLEKLEPFLLKKPVIHPSTKEDTVERVNDESDLPELINDASESDLPEPVNDANESVALDVEPPPEETLVETERDVVALHDTAEQQTGLSLDSEHNTLTLQYEPPAPPPMNPKSLFMTTHEETMDRDQCEDAWRVLPRHRKIRYTTAVKTLKKDFLIKYRIYLMSLSNEELARHLEMKNLTL